MFCCAVSLGIFTRPKGSSKYDTTRSTRFMIEVYFFFQPIGHFEKLSFRYNHLSGGDYSRI